MSTETKPKPETTTNGHVPMGSFIVRRREEWTTIADGPYEGARFRYWVNHPNALWNQAIYGRDVEARDAGYAAIFLEHDGWGEQDAEGNFKPYPPLSDWALFREAIPQGLLEAMVGHIQWARTELPNSMRPTAKPSEKS